jgi:guanine deaminase
MGCHFFLNDNFYLRASVSSIMSHPNTIFMKQAIDLAKKGHGVAALIVKDNEVIATGTSSMYIDNIATHHGEINAIESACKQLQTKDLSGCWLYTTYEPCPMCASACVWAKMAGVVYGASMDDANETYTQRVLIRCEEVVAKGTPQLSLVKDFMRDECKKLLDLPLAGK